MKITPLDGSIGAEVTDVDLGGTWTHSPLQVDAIRDAFASRHLLIFRDPDLAPEDQVRLVEALGLVPDEMMDGAKFGFLSNKLAAAPNDGQHNAYLFHSDLIWKDQPISAISLYAMVIPQQPAPTLFADGVRAAAALPPELKEKLTGLHALFLIDFTGGGTRYREEAASPNAKRAIQPILYDDPVSGRTSLVVDSLFMDKIIGWDFAESERLREELHGYLYEPANIYRHDWAVGDLVLWNNIALQHARPEIPDDAERTHRRVSATRSSATKGWDDIPGA